MYEDETAYAFLDIRPVTRGHTLVVPKQHATDLTELDAETGAHLFRVGHRLARAIRCGEPAADGANLVLNDGTAAFQTVGHVHLHIIPRRNGDKIRLVSGLLLRRPHDADATAATIRAGLAALERDAPESGPANRAEPHNDGEPPGTADPGAATENSENHATTPKKEADR